MRRLVAPAIGTILLCVALVAPSSAAAAPAGSPVVGSVSAEPVVQAVQATMDAARALQRAAGFFASRGFDIENRTAYPIRLSSIESEGAGDDHLRVGDVLQPGASTHYEKVERCCHQETTLHFSIEKTLTDGRTYLTPLGIKLTITVGIPSIRAYEYDGSDFSVVSHGTALAVHLKTPTTIVVPSSDRAKQGKLLAILCATKGSFAQCRYIAKSKEPGVPLTEVIYHVSNNSPLVYKRTKTLTITAETAQTIETSASASVSLFEVFTVGIQATWGKSWTDSKSIEDSFEITVDPYHYWPLTTVIPTEKISGDFEVRLNNVTWYFRDASYTIPDATRAQLEVPYSELLTADERATLPKGQSNR